MSADPRSVLHALAADDGEGTCLAVVLDTEGSTYAHAGALALFGGARGQVCEGAHRCVLDRVGGSLGARRRARKFHPYDRGIVPSRFIKFYKWIRRRLPSVGRRR